MASALLPGLESNSIAQMVSELGVVKEFSAG